MVAIGIDLGTTYSCVAVWRQGMAEVIANDQGNRITPSYVAFTSTGRLIGESAKKQSPVNPLNTVFGAKRLMGRWYDDFGFQMDLRNWPYRVFNENGKPIIIQVKYKGENKKFAPEEISGMILFKMKEIAEAYLGCSVDSAVITVPAYFNDAQRQATTVAGMLAGLNVLRIINEPTAAALAYGLEKNFIGNKTILIYDLGGGTFDVSILTVAEGTVFEVKSTAGNTQLGGEDFDNRLVAYFVEDFLKRFNIDILPNVRALRRLKAASEKTKKSLTYALEATVFVESLYDSIDYCGKISRALFEELCSDLFRDTIGPVEQALKDSRLTKGDIDDIILIGGSTRIPKIRSLLTDFFNGKPLTTTIHPDIAVACGAAIQAAILGEGCPERFQNVLLVDVVPLSLGIETARGIMFKVIERNTAIPCRQTKDLTTLEDYQNCMTIVIFEGERSLTKDNNLLGVFYLKDIPPAPRGVAKIDITFDVDANGILTVSARDRSTGNSETVVFRNEFRLAQDEIAKMIADAEKFKKDDEERKSCLEARNQLENYVYHVKNTIKENGEKLSDEELVTMSTECEKALVWLDYSTNCIREEYERKMTELMKRWSDIMKKFYDHKLRHKIKRRRSENDSKELERSTS